MLMDNSLTQDNLESLQSHILAEEQKHPGATGEFTWIVSAISLILALLSYLGEGNNPAVTALLWLGVAVAFAISGSALGGILVTQLVVLRVSN